ncbi:uncharacterized protein LOC131889777 [Tigriopus californicus]|uniref:uncharacterized protein LOC131889777 n=1 Tax=Tigriopus californicus TaxID=6832 RepID=UPI0027DA32C5|nr:uncharacterized protein LOC131889777 [Tigriopus californicus]XP_059094934.1 uncharacterized protein LOC131889777 [Tigriopus californicus]XP_059094936.1 uncharacterized protein LOC131889777 [Tigriopus californicus]XP_059094937.1 uncharacterized protein LOC131889777 [Tigriopus californicus]
MRAPLESVSVLLPFIVGLVGCLNPTPNGNPKQSSEIQSPGKASSLTLNSPRLEEERDEEALSDGQRAPLSQPLADGNNISISLAFVFDLVHAQACHQFGNGLQAIEELQGGEQLAKVAQWTLSTLKKLRPEFALIVDAIDLYSIDTCGNLSYSLAKILSIASQERLLQNPDGLFTWNDSLWNQSFANQTFVQKQESECQTNLFSGFYLATNLAQDIGRQLKVLPSFPLNLVGEGDLYFDTETFLAYVSLLKRLKWYHVVVLAENELIIGQFTDVATQDEICIVDSIAMDTHRDEFGMHSGPFGHNSTWNFGTSNIVYLGRPSRVSQLLSQHSREGSHWILPFMPSSHLEELFPQGQPNYFKRLYFVQKNIRRLPDFWIDNGLENSSTSSSSLHPLSMPMAFEDNRAWNVSKAIVSTVLHFNEAIAKGQKPSPSSSKSCVRNLSHDMPTVMSDSQFQRVLNLSSSETISKAVFSIYQMNSSGELEGIGEFFPHSRKLTLLPHFQESILISDLVYLPNFPIGPWEEDFRCVNLPVYSLAQTRMLAPSFKMEPWIIILITIGSVGIVVAVSIMLYILSKVCAEVVDGSQSLSIVFLAAIVFMYGCVVPFGFYPDPLICLLRLYGTRLAYALVFAVLLSRSLMLATADIDGLPGHVSGLIQAFLLIMMTGFQVGLSTQEWFLREQSFTMLTIAGRYEQLECADKGISVIVSLSYVMILLLLQLIISPFIVSSRRNYKEGFLFCLASVVCLILWLGWTISYVIFGAILDPVWYDIIECIGLTATATCLLLVIFIPKCYMMATPPYIKSNGTTRHPNSSVSLQRINDISTAGSSSSTSDCTQMTPANSHQNNLQVLGTTTTCSTTEDRGYPPGNDYLSPSDLYDSLKGTFIACFLYYIGDVLIQWRG